MKHNGMDAPLRNDARHEGRVSRAGPVTMLTAGITMIGGADGTPWKSSECLFRIFYLFIFLKEKKELILLGGFGKHAYFKQWPSSLSCQRNINKEEKEIYTMLSVICDV